MTVFSVLGMLVSNSKADNQHGYVFMNTYISVTLVLYTLQMGTIYQREEYIF